MIAKIVIGMQYGDEGKGISTDFLCSLSSANDYFFENGNGKCVVRFSGGQQAAHSVWIDGKSHIHSSFGSGTLRGVPSYFSEHCTIYPLTIMREWDVLVSKGVKPKLTIHPMAKVTTPFDIIYGRIREEKKGHGSCGLGVGATMNRNNTTPYKLYAIDLFNQKLLQEKLFQIYQYYLNKLELMDKKKFKDLVSEELEAFNESLDNLKFDIQSYGYLKKFYEIIFEGSQGILLDMDHGIFPNVTYGNVTSKNALEICSKLNIKDVEIYYVTRCYQNRHGAGWMSNNRKISLINNDTEINKFNEWQKDFRIGELDYDLLQYSIDVDNIYSEDIPKNIIMTCMDQRDGFIFEFEKLKIPNLRKILYSYSPDSNNIMESEDFIKEKIKEIFG